MNLNYNLSNACSLVRGAAPANSSDQDNNLLPSCLSSRHLWKPSLYFPMPKTHSSSSVESVKKKKITKSVSLHGLSKIQEDGKAKHLKAPKTSSKYLEMVIAGRKWLDEHCKQDGTPPLDASLPQNELPQFDSADNEENQRAYNLPYHSLHLLDRKGWQKKLSKTEREADLKSVLSIQIFSNHH